MNIKMLEYIHELMRNEEQTRRGAKELAYEVYVKAEESGAPNKDFLRTSWERSSRRLSEARRMLEEFEDLEWS